MKKGLPPPALCTAHGLEGVQQRLGSLDGRGLTCGIVASRFNTELTHGLLGAAVRVLTECGMARQDIVVAWVPGAFEIPTLLEVMARQGTFHALIALGAVLEGETPHAQAINRGITGHFISIARTYRIPVVDGVVCAATFEQAEARCRPGGGNRGAYAARAAIEMARVRLALGKG